MSMMSATNVLSDTKAFPGRQEFVTVTVNDQLLGLSIGCTTYS
jgi:hypothetical protein